MASDISDINRGDFSLDSCDSCCQWNTVHFILLASWRILLWGMQTLIIKFN